MQNDKRKEDAGVWDPLQEHTPDDLTLPLGPASCMFYHFPTVPRAGEHMTPWKTFQNQAIIQSIQDPAVKRILSLGSEQGGAYSLADGGAGAGMATPQGFPFPCHLTRPLSLSPQQISQLACLQDLRLSKL